MYNQSVEFPMELYILFIFGIFMGGHFNEI